ncbi:MAG TPA: alkaline phosphatase family protein [Mycobacterium sp.]
MVSSLLSWAGLDPSMSNSPAAPATTPMLWTVLAWARKEMESLRNQTSDVGAASVTTSLVQSANLLVNPGAEFGDPSLSGFSSVTVPGWTVTGTPTVIKYGTKVRLPLGLSFPGPTLPAFLGFPTAQSAPPDSGDQFFGGGNVATSTITQTVDLNDAASLIDAGNLPFTLSAALGGKGLQRSAASVTVNFLDENHLFISSGQLAPVTPLNRLFRTGLVERETSGTVPTLARYAQVVVTFDDDRNYNNAYADDLSFTVGDPSLTAPSAPTVPVSTVGSLDHVFMVYMENKGFDDIVGSPNAPYMNSLINTYGFASNYYALTHPSLPNYYPIIGGSDFGVNFNCPSDCFDPPSNLADEIEAAGQTWAAYEQNGGGTTSPGQTPFLAFHDIFDNPARVANIKPLTDMAGALESAATTPNFVWFQPDEDHNGEGPIDTLAGALRFALTQITPGHQYNVKAADQFLQDTLPTILNSNVWNDPTQKSAIVVTFDEDNNNLSLGFGNEGNHIVTVVIPSPGAVAAGMRGGPFIATDYYNHYSLQRTIEDALGLAPLTDNDKYAQPMNEFWQTPVVT